MNHTFSVNGWTISVRPRTGLDDLDDAYLHAVLVAHVTGIGGAAGFAKLNDRDWFRIQKFTAVLQQSTVEGEGFALPSTDAPQADIGAAYDAWLTAIVEHDGLYEQWNTALDRADRVHPDPQAKSGGKKSTDA